MKKIVKVILNPSLAIRMVVSAMFRRILNRNRSFALRLYQFTSSFVLRDSNIRHTEPSIIYSKEDSTTTQELIKVISDSAKLASEIQLSCGKENSPYSKFLNVFPGEHYRLLNALVQVTESKKIVEIGTYTGLGSLALRDGIEDASVVTYDLIEWDKLGIPSDLRESDFADNKIIQLIGDLSEDKFFEENIHILNDADLIFMDAAKDDKFEYKMAVQFAKLDKKESKYLILDDIQFVTMIDFWRAISSPKIDVTCFGHYCGTGIVDISKGFKFDRE